MCLDGWALHIGPRMGSTEPGASPNDEPATPLGNSRVTEGPSSVSESLTVIFKQQERGSKMSKPMKAILVALLIALVSSVLLQNHRLTVLKSAWAAETRSVQTANTATHKQLHQLLLKRKDVLDSIVDNINRRRESGRWDLREYSRAKKTALLAGIDLCETKEERVGIRKEIVQLHDAIDRQILMETAAGAIGPQGLAEAKAARLESEIDLLREQLK